MISKLLEMFYHRKMTVNFCYLLQMWFFGFSGEALTMRLRLATFKALLRQVSEEQKSIKSFIMHR